MALDKVRVNERSTKVVEFDILDADGDVVPAASLDAAELTLIDMDTYEPGASPPIGILNDRDAQDVLNANHVAIDSAGHVTWTQQPDDNVIVTPRREIERHRATFAFIWPTGRFNYECEIEVINLRLSAS